MMLGASAWEVSAVYARYSFGVDSRRADLIEGCFTPTASLGVAGQAPIVGAKLIADRLIRVADPTVVHHAFNIVVLDATSDEVVARADFTMARYGHIFATGHYEDTLAGGSDGTWVFRRRLVTYTWRAPT